MREVDRITRKAAASNAPVLILGEIGTGKELIAAAIHRFSHRSGGPFVKVNCGACSEQLLQSELFGHVQGAFSGAISNRAGRLAAADAGSIFLAEIDATTIPLQIQLLRLLQEKTFERIGDATPQRTDTRVIAASNRDLMRQVHSERFREDLYWRLNVIPIEIPALRHRREDIPALVSFFLDHYNDANDRYVSHIGRHVMLALQEYHWPGNVRELQNYIERAVVMSDTDELTLDLLPACVTTRDASGGGLPAVAAADEYPVPPPAPGLSAAGSSLTEPASASPAAYVDRMDAKTLTRFVVARGLSEAAEDENVHAAVVDQIEKELIAQVLAQCGGVQTRAAARLGMNRNTLYKKIKQYDLS